MKTSKVINRIVSILIILSLVTINTAFAQEGNMCGTELCDADSALVGIITPFLSLVSFLYKATGIIFLFMMAISGLKYVLSLGDPKAMEGAKQSLTFSVMGFAVALLIYVIYRVVERVVGVEVGYLNPGSGGIRAKNGIQALLDFLNTGWKK